MEKRLEKHCSNVCPIGHFTVVCSVTWPKNGCEAAGELDPEYKLHSIQFNYHY